MKSLSAVVVAMLLPLALGGAELPQHTLMMSMDDQFTVTETDQWQVTVERQLDLRYADVKIKPKNDRSFSLMLYFKCDTPDLAQFNSPEKIERSVRSSSEKYLSDTVEKAIELKPIVVAGGYGCYVVLTDAKLAPPAKVPEGEFKYITRGMVRISQDSALGFSLMTNDLDSPQYQEIFKYILSFVKPNTLAGPRVNAP